VWLRVASTAPGSSLAATLGLIVAVGGIRLQPPAVLLVAFIPTLLIAAAYLWSFLLIGVAPLAGGLILTAILVRSVIDPSDPANAESGDSWFGLGPPLVIGSFFLVMCLVLMSWWRYTAGREFWRRRPSVVDPAIASGAEQARIDPALRND
jgi:hypothetical protein